MTKEFLFKLPRFAYFSFGGGIRSCIGETFAVQEGILALATIFKDGRLCQKRRKV
ncbi:MAG TPA: cytochrome P450 [Nitrososphaeraceae archaeon]|nr:cytochrome P450 [Nitrososphaeraceae archaeon]